MPTLRNLKSASGLLWMSAIGVWAVVLAIILVRSWLEPYRNTVYPIFATAAREWTESKDVYDLMVARQFNDRFRYAPIIAVAFTPFAAFPDVVGGVLWRIVNISVCLIGVVAFAFAVFPGKCRLNRQTAAVLAFLLLPLSMGSMNNGQPNSLVVGCLMLAAACIATERLNLAAVSLAAPVLFKIYPISVVALFLLIRPRLGWRVGAVLALGYLAPFAAQTPDFVAASYVSWTEQLATDNRHYLPMQNSYRDFHLLTRIVGSPMEDQSYQLLQLAMGGLVAVVVLSGHWRGWALTHHLRAAFDLGCCWMIVFGPATENCTYGLLAPTLALAFWESFQSGPRLWKRCLIWSASAVLFSSVLISVTPYGKSLSYILAPTGGLLMFVERLLNYCISHQEMKTIALPPQQLARAA